VEIPSRPSCPKCRIELIKLFTLGGATDTTHFETLSLRAIQDSRGRIYVGPIRWTSILVFDSTGQRLGSIGRPGKGPGEFDVITDFVVGNADSLHVLDLFGVRATILEPEFHKYVRVTEILDHQRQNPVVMPSGEMVAFVSFPGDTGIVLHSPQGKVLRRFGVVMPPDGTRERVEGSHTATYLRWLSLADSTRIWMARPGLYRIERWNIRGGIDLALERSPVWWRGETEGTVPRYYREQKPKPLLFGIYQDSERRLWVTVRVPKADWKQLDPIGTDDRCRRTDTALKCRSVDRERADYLDTMIEILDPATGKLITSQRFPYLFSGQGIQQGGLVTIEEENADGVLYWHIYRLRLREQ
jgi:hypothetical protein